MDSFLSRIKNSPVARWASLYVLAAWVILQVGDVVIEPLGLPDAVQTGLIVLLASAFPIVILALYFNRSRLVDVDFTSPGAAQPAAADTERRIAVMPFESQADDLGGLAGRHMAEHVIDRLATHDGLAVVSSTSSFRIADAELSTLRRKLRATHVIYGRLESDSTELRARIELVNTNSEATEWSDQFEFSAADPLGAREHVATQISRRLGGDEMAGASADADSIDRRAYQQYLLAHHAFDKSNLPKALEHAEKSLEIDKNNPLAETLLAQVFFTWATYGVVPHEDPLMLSRKHLKKALHVQPHYAPAKKIEAELALTMERDYAKALEVMREATVRRMNVGDSMPLLLAYGFRYDDAIALLKRLVDKDPLNLMHMVRLQRLLRYVGRQNEADSYHQLCLDNSTEHALILQDKIEIAVQNDDPDSARAGLDNLVKLASRKLKWWPAEVMELWLGSRVEMAAGNAELARSKANALAKRADTAPTLKVEAYLNAHCMDEAYYWSDEAVVRYDPGAYQITCPFATRSLTDPFFMEFQADDRHQGLLTRLGVDEASLAELDWFDINKVLL